MHSTRFQRLHRRFGAALMPSRIAFLAVLLYLISLIPIFLFSSYCHPLADDFTYGLLVHRAVVSGGGIPEILSAAAETVRDYYFTWQGTFSAIFLFALQPGAFSESAYFLTPFIIIGCLSLSTFVLMHFVYCRLLGGKSSQAVILSALTLLLSVQMVTNQAQAFYWFNGASYYAVFYSFSLLFFAGIGTLLLDAGKKVHPVLTGCCALLAVLIGGGNYSTALTTSFIASVLCAAWLFFKKPGRFRLAVILLILLVSFAISVLAPGNAVRAAREASISPVLAILLSLSNAVIWVMSWVNLPQIVLFVIAGVFFYCLPDRRILPFRHPVLASILIFGLYASQYTPPLYAMGYIGSGASDQHLLLQLLLVHFCNPLLLDQLVQTHPFRAIRAARFSCCTIPPGSFLSGRHPHAGRRSGGTGGSSALSPAAYLRQGNHCHCRWLCRPA